MPDGRDPFGDRGATGCRGGGRGGAGGASRHYDDGFAAACLFWVRYSWSPNAHKNGKNGKNGFMNLRKKETAAARLDRRQRERAQAAVAEEHLTLFFLFVGLLLLPSLWYASTISDVFASLMGSPLQLMMLALCAPVALFLGVWRMKRKRALWCVVLGEELGEEVKKRRSELCNG